MLREAVLPCSPTMQASAAGGAVDSRPGSSANYCANGSTEKYAAAGNDNTDACANSTAAGVVESAAGSSERASGGWALKHRTWKS